MNALCMAPPKLNNDCFHMSSPDNPWLKEQLLPRAAEGDGTVHHLHPVVTVQRDLQETGPQVCSNAPLLYQVGLREVSTYTVDTIL